MSRLLHLLTTQRNQTFGIWAFSDQHVSADTGRLQQAVQQIDNETWDIALNLGDAFKADAAGDTEGQQWVSELDNFTNHNISSVYSIMGNHDANDESDPVGPNYYFQKYVDPAGNNPTTSKIVNAYRPYAINALGNDDYASFYLKIGNMLIIMLGDRNEGPPPMGEDGLGTGSANFRASGGLTLAEWNAFTSLVENNTDKIIIVCSHQGIRDTTIGTGNDEFFPAFYRMADPYSAYPDRFGDITEAKKAGYIAYIENTLYEDTINTWITQNGQYIDLWMTGHYHRKINDSWAGRTRFANAFGTNFLNIASVNSILHNYYWGLLESKSNLIEIKGSTMTIRTYIHYDQNGIIPQGFYNEETITLQLKRRLIF